MRLLLAKRCRQPRLENRALLLTALKEAVKQSGVDRLAEGRDDAELHVVMVNESRMAELNDRFLGHEGSTDVLAFSFTGDDAQLPDDEPVLVGEIYLCLDVAQSAAKRYGTSLGEECLLYAVHGMLHLVGMDDGNACQRAAMKAAEQRIMAGLRDRLPLTAVFGF